MSKDGAFGFEELEKTLKKMESKYPSKADAVLMSLGRAALAKTKDKTPVGKTKKLKGSWRVKRPKKYGNTRVVRLQSVANHAHLVEDGHEIVNGGRARGRNQFQKVALGVKQKGRVEGRHMLRGGMKETEVAFYKKAEKMLDDLIKEAEL